MQHNEKMAKIIDCLGVGIGVFEVRQLAETVYVSKSMYRLLGVCLPEHGGSEESGPCFISVESFLEMLPQYKTIRDEGYAEMQFKITADGTYRWLELRVMEQEEEREALVCGVVIDITDRMNERESLIYENNYDELTKLLSRNAYLGKIEELIAEEPDKYGVLAFLDLDKLKRINDSYGHEAGDMYIKMAGDAFAELNLIGGVASRISGDEFVLYLHGGTSRAAMMDKMLAKLMAAGKSEMAVKDGTVVKLSFSTGLAYYPEDSHYPDTLVKYADFAMYEVKQSSKGGVIEFDRGRYERSGTHTDYSSYIQTFLTGQDVRYAFQPIVDFVTGEINSYEAVMRPIAQVRYSPFEILEQAKAEDKLYELELFLFEGFCKWVNHNMDKLSGYTITFNATYDQYLTDEHFQANLRQMGDVARAGVAVVMEVSAGAYSDGELLKRKVNRARYYGIMISLDDYCGTSIQKRRLEELKPEYLKISHLITRGISKDTQKQEIAREAVNLAKLYDVKIIAEGVETVYELRTLMDIGVFNGQGFYFCPPEFRLLRKLPEHVIEEIITLPTKNCQKIYSGE